MFIKLGSSDENEQNNGVAHFLEHLMFKSTIKRPKKTLLSSLDNLGTYYNAGTTRDHTYYEINGDKKDIDEILDIILDLYSNPVYEDNEIELEKGVIIEEMKMYQDNTTRSLFDYIMSEIFKGTPLEKNIIGTEKNILNMTKEDINNFRKLYSLSNSLLVVVGNFSKNNVINIIKKHLKENKTNNLINEQVDINYKITSKKPNVYIIPNKNIGQSYIYVSFYFDSLSFEEECILEFISNYLSSGSTSKLFEILRNKLGSSYSNDTSYLTFRGKYGMFYVYCNVNNNLILESIKEILIIFKNLKNKEISNDEMNKVKKIYETNNLFNLNNPVFLMMYHGTNYLFNKEYNINDELNIIKELDSKKIKNFCDNFFIKKNMNIFVYGNNIDPSDLSKVINEI
jgi:predicted Zn-dependent peptidase